MKKLKSQEIPQKNELDAYWDAYWDSKFARCQHYEARLEPFEPSSISLEEVINELSQRDLPKPKSFLRSFYDFCLKVILKMTKA